MTFRHEDYPCCGCGSEGCVDTTRSVRCRQCRRSYHPDQNTEEYCYRCQIPNPHDDPDGYDEWRDSQMDRDREQDDYEQDTI